MLPDYFGYRLGQNRSLDPDIYNKEGKEIKGRK